VIAVEALETAVNDSGVLGWVDAASGGCRPPEEISPEVKVGYTTPASSCEDTKTGWKYTTNQAISPT